jgi:triosephosphate isomerase
MKKIIIGNWKLNLDHLEAIQLFQKLNYSLNTDIDEKISIVVAPSHTSLRSIQTIIDADKLNIFLSSQDVSMFNDGAYTGEVSAHQLAKLNISYCIVGHSERRQHFNETDEFVNVKVNNLINKEITPIICFGESNDQRTDGNYMDFLINQIENSTKGLRKDKVDEIIFAYEPIWAIGTGQNASLQDIVEVISKVKEFISKKSFFNEEKIKFIYGGSVSPDNSYEILNSKIIDGALVGGASLDVDKFIKIIESVDL